MPNYIEPIWHPCVPAILLGLQLVEVSVEGRRGHPLVAVVQLRRGEQHEVGVVRVGQPGVARAAGVHVGLKRKWQF